MRIYQPQSTRAIPPGAKVNEEKKTVTYRGRDGKPVRAVLTDTGKMRVSQGTWHVGFRDHLDREQDLPAFSRERQTRTLADQIESLIAYCGQLLPHELQEYCDHLPTRIVSALQACGLLAGEQTPLGKPLSELVSMYEQTLRSKERSACHIERTIGDIMEVFEGCAFNFWRDIKAEKVENYLKDRRDGRVLRMNRHDKDGHPIGVGYARSNAYITAVVGFCNWVVYERKWSSESPLRRGMKLNAKDDQRHPRRAIPVEQVRTLLQKTAEGPERYGMTGRERYLLYRTIIETGLRAGELRRLKTCDFDLDARTLTVRGVKATKNKRTKVQSLSPGLCAELRGFLASKLPDAKVFGGSYMALTDKTSDMLQEDLAAAGIRYKDDMGACFDFHALRGECATLLVESGVDAKQAQEVMRHSSITMTMDTYARISSSRRKAAAVASLPDLSLPESQQQAVALTGTDGAGVIGEIYLQNNPHRTIIDSIGQGNGNSSGIRAVASQNQGSYGIVVPRVASSNLVSHPFIANDGKRSSRKVP